MEYHSNDKKNITKVRNCQDCIYSDICEDEDSIFSMCAQFLQNYTEYSWVEMSYNRYSDGLLTWTYSQYSDGDWEEGLG